MRLILQLCSVGELRSCARLNNLPDSGTRDKLVSTLMQSMGHGYPTQNILESLGNEQLRKICREYELPVSGTKDALVQRLLTTVTIPKKRPEDKLTKKLCWMCGHLWDQMALDKHHFVPKSRTDWGGNSLA